MAKLPELLRDEAKLILAFFHGLVDANFQTVNDSCLADLQKLNRFGLIRGNPARSQKIVQQEKMILWIFGRQQRPVFR